MDIDAYIAAHTVAWRRLEQLVVRAGRPGRCTGRELDELVELYQRTATHLSVIRSASPDVQLVDRLSTLVARARSVVAGGRRNGWRDASRFAAVSFPAAVWRSRWWVGGAAAGFLLVAFAMGWWVASSDEVQRSIAAPEEVRRLVEQDFANYYRSEAASSFAARVFTNNAQVAALAFAAGILLGIPTVLILLVNAVNVGVVGGLMVSAGRGDVFFGLILPHGLLEITAIWVAAGVGLRIGWCVVDPGPRRRAEALAEEGRAAVAVVLGLVLVFLVAGVIEAFVTPSGLPTAGRVGIGVAVELLFLGGVGWLGRRAVAAGETGDLLAELRGDVAPAV